jgi:hypothetical protein
MPNIATCGFAGDPSQGVMLHTWLLFEEDFVIL